LFALKNLGRFFRLRLASLDTSFSIEWSFAPFTYAPFIPVNYTDGRQVAMKKLTAKINKLTKEVGRKETCVKFMFFFLTVNHGCRSIFTHRLFLSLPPPPLSVCHSGVLPPLFSTHSNTPPRHFVETKRNSH
jgi:hypothetical protein